jgi:hypothetical protein
MLPMFAFAVIAIVRADVPYAIDDFRASTPSASKAAITRQWRSRRERVTTS